MAMKIIKNKSNSSSVAGGRSSGAASRRPPTASSVAGRVVSGEAAKEAAGVASRVAADYFGVARGAENRVSGGVVKGGSQSDSTNGGRGGGWGS